MNTSTTPTTTTEKIGTWVDTVKEYAQVDKLSQRFNISSQQFIEVITYLGISFVVGFVFKKFSRYLIIGAIAVVVALVFLEAFEIITIDWVQLRQMTGVNPQDTVGGLMNVWFELVRINILVVVSCVVGFFIGYKVG